MFKELGKKIEKLTLELTKIPSVVGTRQENDMSKKVYEKFTEMDYFKNNPENLKYVYTLDDPLERKSVVATLKGEKGNSKKTVVLIGHTDTVGISDYGQLEKYATDPSQLIEKYKDVIIPEDAKKDLDSGDYLFGRGVFDMKCGVATLMSIVESIGEDVDNFEGNIVFAGVCDEEGNSAGMLSVVPELIKMAEEEGFDYQALLDTDYSAPRFEGDNTRYVYVGTVGKLMPSFYIVGSEAHAGDPFRGLDPNHISSAITMEMDFNTKYADEAEGEVTVPPISLRQEDLKEEYSVQTAKTSYLYFNFGTHSSTPDQMMDRVLDGSRLAFEKVIDDLNKEYEKYCHSNKFPYKKLPWQAKVITYDDLYKKVKVEKGKELDEVLDKLEKDLLKDENIDDRVFALKMVEKLHSMWSDKNPVVVVYYSPPYYPHIYVEGKNELEKKLLNVANEIIEETDSDYNIEVKKFYPYISDLSYAAAPKEETAISSLKNNMPGFASKYKLPIEDMQKLDLPVVNIGPFGKDAHKFTERLEKDYSFNVAPKLVYQAIIKLLK